MYSRNPPLNPNEYQRYAEQPNVPQNPNPVHDPMGDQPGPDAVYPPIIDPFAQHYNPTFNGMSPQEYIEMMLNGGIPADPAGR